MNVTNGFLEWNTQLMCARANGVYSIIAAAVLKVKRELT
jgi:hypothetical protein